MPGTDRSWKMAPRAVARTNRSTLQDMGFVMMRKKLIALPLALLLGTASMAATISRTELDAFKPAPAQALVDKIIARNPDMLDVLLHVTPPTGDRNLVVAAHVAANLGEISGEDDLSVADTGKPIVEVRRMASGSACCFSSMMLGSDRSARSG
jgi:hypothetical protein